MRFHEVSSVPMPPCLAACLALHIKPVTHNTSVSRQDSLDHLAGDIRQAVVASLMLEGQTLVVDAKQREYRGVEVMDVNRVGDDVVAERVGLAVSQTRLDSTPRGPDGEAAGMMVAAIVGRRELALAVVRPAELTSPEDQCILEHAPLLEVLDQAGAGLVGLAAEDANARRQAAVMIPAGKVKLDEPDVALGQAPGQQAVGRRSAHRRLRR